MIEDMEIKLRNLLSEVYFVSPVALLPPLLLPSYTGNKSLPIVPCLPVRPHWSRPLRNLYPRAPANLDSPFLTRL